MNHKFICAKNIEIMEIENEWIVMDAENFTMTKVNTIGADVVTALKGQQSMEDIIQQIRLRYGITESEARTDFLLFMKELEGVGLITHGEN